MGEWLYEGTRLIRLIHLYPMNLQIEDKASNAASTLKQLYAKLLKPFEEHCLTRNRGGASLLGTSHLQASVPRWLSPDLFTLMAAVTPE